MIYLNTDDLSYTLTYYFFVCLFDSVFRIKILALPRLLAKRFLVSQTDLHKFTTIYIAERWKIYLKNFKVHHCINFFIYPGTFLAHRMNILRSWCSFVINVLWLWINFTQFLVFIFELEQENVGWLAGWLANVCNWKEPWWCILFQQRKPKMEVQSHLGKQDTIVSNNFDPDCEDQD